MDEKKIDLELDVDMLNKFYVFFKSDPIAKAVDKSLRLCTQTFARLKFPSEKEQEDELRIYAFQIFCIGVMVGQECQDMGIKFRVTAEKDSGGGKGG